jgi:FtsX-like permease family protein
MARPSTTTARGTTTTAKRRRGGLPLVATLTLAWWRLRQTWRLLLVSGLGIVAAVMLVCAVPLFSQVAMSAGLRSALTAFPQASQIIIQGNTAPGASPDLIAQARSRIDAFVRHEMGPYLADTPPDVSVSIPAPLNAALASGGETRPLVLSGFDLSTKGKSIALVQGRLPNPASDQIEILIDKASADSMGIHAGDALSLHVSFGGPNGPSQTPPLQVRVVGIAAQLDTDNVIVGKGFNGFGPSFSGNVIFFGPGEGQPIFAAAANETILSAAAPLFNGQNGPPLLVNWTYPLDLDRISAASFGDLRDRVSNLQAHGFDALHDIPGMQQAFPEPSVEAALDQYLGRVIVVQIPVVLLLIQVMGLVLLFVSLMVNLLIERQVEAISVLRSRGASRGVVLRSLTAQSIGVGVLALIAGPLLAVTLVRLIAARVLPPASQAAVGIVSGNPIPVALDQKWFALAAAVVAVFAMIVSTRRAANLNVLALRRESARVTRKPFWVRLNLDLVFGGIAILGYVAYTYAVNNVDSRVRPFLAPLSLFAMLFLLVAIALIFLRFFPLLLRLGARLAARGRSAPAMLAIGQMARSPRQAGRMTLLLALSTAFALFSLVFTASVGQRVLDVAAFQVGSDFSGQLDAGLTGKLTPDQLTARYAAIPGVTAATVGYSAGIDPNGVPGNLPIQMLAMDTSTFARTALWSSTYSKESIDELMARMAASRGASASDPVPAILDTVTWNALRLTKPGDTFSMQVNHTDTDRVRFRAVAEVDHIPTIYSAGDSNFGSSQGGMLVDYAALAPALQAVSGQASVTVAAPNTLWLRTRDDDASLKSVRAALLAGDLAIGSPLDRRALIDTAHGDALNIDLLSVLGIAAATALALAVLGIVIASWISARVRVTSFALLRALGSEPRQLAGVLFWEQGIVYTLALALGVGLGAVLTAAVLPLLVFVSNASNRGFVPVDIPPVRTVLPPGTLLSALGALVVVCVLAILLMVSVVSRASISQTLRLNED